VQTAFEVAEQHCDGLDPLLFRQILETLFANLLDWNALAALFLRLQVQIFDLCVR